MVQGIPCFCKSPNHCRLAAGMEMADVKKNMESKVPGAVTMSSLESPAGCPPGCTEERDPYIVDFEGPDDPASPATWSKTRKWCTVGLLSSMMLVV